MTRRGAVVDQPTVTRGRIGRSLELAVAARKALSRKSDSRRRRRSNAAGNARYGFRAWSVRASTSAADLIPHSLPSL